MLLLRSKEVGVFLVAAAGIDDVDAMGPEFLKVFVVLFSKVMVCDMVWIVS